MSDPVRYSTGENAPGRFPRRTFALWLLTVGGAAYSLVAVVNLFRIDWDGMSRGFHLNLGIVVISGAVAWLVSVGLFGALPIAAGYELRRSRAISVRMCAVSAIAAVVALPFLGWFGLPAVVVYGLALAVVASKGVRAQLRSGRLPGRFRPTKYASVAYVLLVGGGLLGIHNFYLRRSWAGVMHIGLLLTLVISWPSFLFPLIACGILFLLSRDAIRVPQRVAESNLAV